ncbi:hypothetical protein DUNSADRAFT_2443 [Dunaliella salina]|uniref:P-type ATPase C-terminal domain-containing protein n=1 Tax=Dunaliella salina TaxID=3046 RepID=A0ABQ7GVP3_DUNSA|nr:hypothetical protein DUNSADRAFT_2443 [Dunaliella salina]|eukprot:KAF5838679.1 hypothetical protein DUNSADRAFT_2443 [Dunaliella salina]
MIQVGAWGRGREHGAWFSAYVARLVLLHGRIMYKRNTEVVAYSFYKNWMHNLTFIFFAFVSVLIPPRVGCASRAGCITKTDCMHDLSFIFFAFVSEVDALQRLDALHELDKNLNFVFSASVSGESCGSHSTKNWMPFKGWVHKKELLCAHSDAHVLRLCMGLVCVHVVSSGLGMAEFEWQKMLPSDPSDLIFPSSCACVHVAASKQLQQVVESMHRCNPQHCIQIKNGILLTTFPVSDVTQDTASRFPILYQETMAVGRRHFLLTQFKWLLIGCWHALACECVPMYAVVAPGAALRLLTHVLRFSLMLQGCWHALACECVPMAVGTHWHVNISLMLQGCWHELACECVLMYAVVAPGAVPPPVHTCPHLSLMLQGCWHALACNSMPIYTIVAPGLLARTGTLQGCWHALVCHSVPVSAIVTPGAVLFFHACPHFSPQGCWYALGCWHALACYFVPMYAMVTPDKNGIPDDFTEIGTTIYFASIIVVNLKLCMRTRHWTWINHTIVYLSIFLLLPFIWLYGLVWETSTVPGTADMSRMADRLYSSSRFWLAGGLRHQNSAMLCSLVYAVRLAVHYNVKAPKDSQPSRAGSARRAANAITNLAHENVEIKNMTMMRSTSVHAVRAEHNASMSMRLAHTSYWTHAAWTCWRCIGLMPHAQQQAGKATCTPLDKIGFVCQHLAGAVGVVGLFPNSCSAFRFPWILGPRMKSVILAPAMSLLPDIFIMAYQRTFYPSTAQLLQEAEHAGARVTGRRGIPRNINAEAGTEEPAQGGLIELRAMMPNKAEMSDANGLPQHGKKKMKKKGALGGGPSSDLWV